MIQTIEIPPTLFGYGLLDTIQHLGCSLEKSLKSSDLSGALARMPQIPCNAQLSNFLFKGLIWIMCSSLPQGFLSCNVLQTRLNVCSEGSSQDPFMGVLCMVMLSAVTSVNSEPPDTKFISKKDDTISGWVFFGVAQRKNRHCCTISLWISNKTWPRGLWACVRRVIWGLSLMPRGSHQLICSITS